MTGSDVKVTCIAQMEMGTLTMTHITYGHACMHADCSCSVLTASHLETSADPSAHCHCTHPTAPLTDSRNAWSQKPRTTP